MSRNLELLEALDPVNVCQEKPKSLIPLAVKFPNIVDEAEYEDIYCEWRELTIGDVATTLHKNLKISGMLFRKRNVVTSQDFRVFLD